MAEKILSEKIPSGVADAEPRVISTIQTAKPPFLAKPSVRPITAEDIRGALRDGIADFRAAPKFGLFFGGIYALGGLAMLAFLTVFDMPWMIIFLAVGFPLIGPFVAVGAYEVSRRLSTGEPLEWSAILGVILNQRDRQLAWMAFVVLFIFWIWAYQVRLLVALFLGLAPVSTFGAFIEAVATTPNGLTFLALGTMIGGVLALVLYASTVIAMPMLVDRDIDIVTAVVTSVNAVLSNPKTMIGWGAIVTAVLIVAMLPLFLGLIVALPILGHATWRLYARVVTWREPGEAALAA